jgi:coatomer protein complex subunit alpha (xenin)
MNADRTAADCVATFASNGYKIIFHPSEPLIVTCGDDHTAKLWRMNSDRNAVEYVTTLKGHHERVKSATFHPTEPLIVTYSDDYTTKLWHMNYARTAADCVATLKRYKKNHVNSVAFHSSEPLIATANGDIIRLWK